MNPRGPRILLVALLAAAPAKAEPTSPEGECRTATPSPLTLSGNVETYYAWNFNRPANAITNNRAPDLRHNSFTLSNAVLEAGFSLDRVQGRLALQSGSIPYTQYSASTTTRDRSGASDGGSWRFLQQANIGFRTPVGAGLLVEMGLFLWPVGPESLAVHDQWNWSRSNLFYAMPIYQTGLRATYPFTRRFSATLAVLNGWYGVVDNNEEKSVAAQLQYSVPEKLTATLRYVGGVERDPETPEGRPWRSLVDATVVSSPTRAFAFAVQANAGGEKTTIGGSWWAGGALYARLQPWRFLFFSLRADGFRQLVPKSTTGSADPILFAAQGVVSGTATVGVRPQQNLAVFLEYRHDQGASTLYFRGEVLGTGSTASPYEPNSYSQDTLLLGGTAWF